MSRLNTGTPGVQWSRGLFIVGPQYLRDHDGRHRWSTDVVRHTDPGPQLGWGIVVVMTSSSSKQPPDVGLVVRPVGIQISAPPSSPDRAV